MISCAANSGPLSVVIDLTGSLLSRKSRTTAFASGTACFPRIEFLHEHKAALPLHQSNGGNTSALIRDAVARFDDRRTRGRIEAMATLLSFYTKYQQQLSWLGGNFNQVMHRANELAIDSKLNESYFHKVIMPEALAAIKDIRKIKTELNSIHDSIKIHIYVLILHKYYDYSNNNQYNYDNGQYFIKIDLLLNVTLSR